MHHNRDHNHDHDRTDCKRIEDLHPDVPRQCCPRCHARGQMTFVFVNGERLAVCCIKASSIAQYALGEIDVEAMKLPSLTSIMIYQSVRKVI